jgi:hypothetical protein
VRFRQTELIEHWIASDPCYNHRLLIVGLFIRVLLFRLVKDKSEMWLQPKAWDQQRRDLRNQ